VLGLLCSTEVLTEDLALLFGVPFSIVNCVVICVMLSFCLTGLNTWMDGWMDGWMEQPGNVLSGEGGKLSGRELCGGNMSGKCPGDMS